MLREYICPVHQETEFHIKMAPLLREEIIRCRDCKYCRVVNTNSTPICIHEYNGKFEIWEVKSDGFCAWAERVD